MNCDDCENVIEEFFREELPDKERNLVIRHHGACLDCRRLYERYEQVEQGLHSLGLVQCPDSVVEAIVRKISAPKGNFLQSLLQGLPVFFQSPGRIVLAGVTVSLLFLVLLIPLFTQQQNVREPLYSKSEILEADRQVKFVLANVNLYSQRVNLIIEHDVLLDGVVLPLQSSIKQALNPIINGEQS